MSASTDKTAKMMERVRALLAKAASTTFPAEADAFRQKADKLMTEYAIEQWQIEQLEAGLGVRPVPEKRLVDLMWWRTNPFRHQLWDLFTAVAYHCRCSTVASRWDYREMKVPVFGIRSDLDWFDMLFTSLMLQMIQQVDPQPKPELTLNENLALMREAGMPWKQAINRIITMGETEDYVIEEGTTFDEVYEVWVHGYRRWCRAGNRKQSKVDQQTFRRNFADGFAHEIRMRLYRIRTDTATDWNAEHESNSMEVAIRDIRDQVNEAVWAEYPDLRPHPKDCDCDKCHFCQKPNCMRPRCKEARKPMRMRKYKGLSENERIAVEAGRRAGATADISNSAAERLKSQRQIER